MRQLSREKWARPRACLALAELADLALAEGDYCTAVALIDEAFAIADAAETSVDTKHRPETLERERHPSVSTNESIRDAADI